MTLKEKIMKLQTYKMFTGEDTVYVERDDVLKLLEQEPRWIPVSERLPKEGKEVLVSGYDTYNKKVSISRYQGEQYGFTCGLVSAWMPLPEPYKSESEEEE